MDWPAGGARSLANEGAVRLVAEDWVVRIRRDRTATDIPVPSAIGGRRDGQTARHSLGNVGGETTAAWQQVLEAFDARDPGRSETAIVEGTAGLEAGRAGLRARPAKRAWVPAAGAHGAESPERSPSTSGSSTGTLAAPIPSARTCTVTVLPGPVAPALSPWRLA